jgi:hypothetical protein
MKIAAVGKPGAPENKAREKVAVANRFFATN